MQHNREPFVEPEIVKHEERMADVTAQVGYGGDLSNVDDVAGRT